MTALYRHFDDTGRLLYIGVSTSPLKRLQEHRGSSHWSAMIRWVQIEEFSTRQEALAAEWAAITKENPLFNKQRPRPDSPSHPAKERPVSKRSGASAVERVRAWRKSHPGKYRSYMREYMKRYREKLKTTI